jgi:hypothetical protein
LIHIERDLCNWRNLGYAGGHKAAASRLPRARIDDVVLHDNPLHPSILRASTPTRRTLMTAVRRSFAYSLADNYLGVVLQLISTFVISRLLSPGEIGIFSVAAALIALASTFRDFGVAEYLIQAPKADDRRLRAALAANLAVSWSVAALLLVVSVPAVGVSMPVIVCMLPAPEVIVTPALLLISRLPIVPVPLIVWAELPASEILPGDAVIVPLLVRSPVKVRMPVPKAMVVPDCTVSWARVAVAGNAGALVVPGGITTTEVLEGTPEGVQLAAVFQSVLTLPFQVTLLTTVTSSTLLSAAPVQSDLQDTLASRLYHVVCVREPGS